MIGIIDDNGTGIGNNEPNIKERRMSNATRNNGKHSKGKKNKKHRKPIFDVIIGNPPYQDEKVGDARSMPPLYDKFMEQGTTG